MNIKARLFQIFFLNLFELKGDLKSEPYTKEAEQYKMRYFQSSSAGSSFLRVEWTNQHGCGSTTDCQQILQFKCQAVSDLNTDIDSLDRIRDGLNTNRLNCNKNNNNLQKYIFH